MSTFKDGDAWRIITEILDRNREINRLGEANAALRAELAKAIDALRPFALALGPRGLYPLEEHLRRAAEVYNDLIAPRK